MTVKLNLGHICAFGRVDEAVTDGKPLQEKVWIVC